MTGIFLALRKELFVPDMQGFLLSAWNGILVMATATTLWAMALESGKTAKISNLAYITPFVSLIWIRLILKEDMAVQCIIGLIIIIVGIFVQLTDKKRSK